MARRSRSQVPADHVREVDRWEKLVRRMGESMASVLGEMTVRMLLRNLLRDMRSQRPVVTAFEQDGVGLDLSEVRGLGEPAVRKEALDALAVLVSNWNRLAGTLAPGPCSRRWRQMVRRRVTREVE